MQVNLRNEDESTRTVLKFGIALLGFGDSYMAFGSINSPMLPTVRRFSLLIITNSQKKSYQTIFDVNAICISFLFL